MIFLKRRELENESMKTMGEVYTWMLTGHDL